MPGADGHGNRFGIALSLLALAILAGRLPYLAAGFGRDPDCWRVAWSARLFADQAGYHVSRFPGYPFQEIMSSLLIRWGPIGLNGASAVFSVVAAIMLALIIRRVREGVALPLALAFAFVPVVLISSTSAIDYVWGTAFTLISFYFAERDRPLLSGLALGIAVGCRITLGAMGLPVLLLLVWRGEPGKRTAAIIRFVAAAAVPTLIWFSLLLSQYGLGFLKYYPIDNTSALKTLRLATVGVFGTAGLIGMGIVILLALLRGRGVEKNEHDTRGVFGAAIVAMLIPLVTYLRVPGSPGYLIPAVPFLLILLTRCTKPAAAWVLALFMVCSPFIDISLSGIERGSFLKNVDTRVERMDVARGIMRAMEGLEGDKVVITGSHYPLIRFMADEAGLDLSHYVFRMEEERFQERLAEGVAIYLAPGARMMTLAQNGYDPLALGARELKPELPDADREEGP